MGIIEFHFHDPDFDFSPSMTTGGDQADEESSDEWSEASEETAWSSESDSEADSPVGLGALVALVVLVVLAALAGLKRRKGTSDDDGEEVELEP